MSHKQLGGGGVASLVEGQIVSNLLQLLTSSSLILSVHGLRMPIAQQMAKPPEGHRDIQIKQSLILCVWSHG